MNSFCDIKDLANESDVEQKLLIPILTSEQPIGLGYKSCDYRTKADIKQLTIGKGKDKKLYFPDYVLIINGLPVAIIEAKKPGEGIEKAFREARLYASELNSSFSSGINPCTKIIVSDGLQTGYGDWDSSELISIIDFNDLSPAVDKFSKFISIFCKKEFIKNCDKLLENIRGKRKFSRPISIIGGNSVRDEKIPENSFGANLALEYGRIFNPDNLEDRIDIVKHAYISSTKLEKHVDPIRRILKASHLPSEIDAKQINDTNNPKEILSKFNNKKVLRQQICLLIGSVGSGKSTFMDYLREVKLDDELKKNLVWVSIDMNTAPLSKESIYKWIQRKIIENLENAHTKIDFNSLEIMKKMYGIELRPIEHGIKQLFASDSKRYNEMVAEKLSKLIDDLDLSTKAHSRFLCDERDKLLVIVLDNVDRRTREDQLLMFQVAKWLKEEYHSLVFLPMRDVTYDNHKNEPPLDTVLKELVFRIDAPKLYAVLNRRIEYALSENLDDELTYELSNGLSVKYKRHEQKDYLKCILRSLFEIDSFSSDLINGIAGKDIRKGIEIFLNFCKSGYITDDYIFKLRVSSGSELLPKHIVTRVILRNNRRYYTDSGSYIKNLFFSYANDNAPNPFIRTDILIWLERRFRTRGPNNTKGYHRVGDLIGSLIPYGHSYERIIHELYDLCISKCISSDMLNEELTDSENENVLSVKDITENTLISIAPSGIVHLLLLKNIDYLASCAEDVWYRNMQIAEKIAERITGKSGSEHLSFQNNIENAMELVDYLIEYRDNFLPSYREYLSSFQQNERVDLLGIKEAIENSKDKNPSFIDRNKVKEKFVVGKTFKGKIHSKKKYGMFILLEKNVVGLLSFNDYLIRNPKDLLMEKYEIGDDIDVFIKGFNEKKLKFDLGLNSK